MQILHSRVLKCKLGTDKGIWPAKFIGLTGFHFLFLIISKGFRKIWGLFYWKGCFQDWFTPWVICLTNHTFLRSGTLSKYVSEMTLVLREDDLHQAYKSILQGVNQPRCFIGDNTVFILFGL